MRLNILLIGCGLHAKHFYIPAFCRYGEIWNAQIAAVLDRDTMTAFVVSMLSESGVNAATYFVSSSQGADMPPSVAELLQQIVRRHSINAVIIATDPLNHKSYVLWALDMGLPILLDKPVTTRRDAALNMYEAQGILQDYDDIAVAYQKCAEPPGFILLAHRRYHPGILAARRLIREISSQTGCPITNIHMEHSDGQWRMPNEILTQKHHSYNEGHGKVSHSGFHFIDCAAEFWRDSLDSSGKAADEIEVSASFIRPQGLLHQLNNADYRRLFGDKMGDLLPSDADLEYKYTVCGEIDAEIGLSLLKDDTAFSLASLSLLHGGFSQRSWYLPGKDLYKGNGRVKHEHHNIHIGPFAAIQIHSYQSKDMHIQTGADDDLPGGNNHYELHVFRNTGMIGGQAYERYDLRELPGSEQYDYDRLYITQVKEAAIIEWIETIASNSPRRQGLHSAFDDHRRGVAIMSAIYRSYCLRQEDKNPLVRIPW